MLGAASIALGYLVLVASFGWPGVAAAAAHVFVMLAAARR